MNDPRRLRPGSRRREGSPGIGGAFELRRLTRETTDGRNGSAGHPDRFPEDLTISIHETGTTIEVVVSGEWDLVQCEAVHDAIREALQRGPECVVLDLSRLSFIDSSGLHTVLELQSRCTHRQIHLVIIPASPAVHRTFEISGLTDVLPFVGSEP